MLMLIQYFRNLISITRYTTSHALTSICYNIKTKFTVEDENNQGHYYNYYSPLLSYPQEEEDTTNINDGLMVDNNESKHYCYTSPFWRLLNSEGRQASLTAQYHHPSRHNNNNTKQQPKNIYFKNNYHSNNISNSSNSSIINNISIINNNNISSTNSNINSCSINNINSNSNKTMIQGIIIIITIVFRLLGIIIMVWNNNDLKTQSIYVKEFHTE